MKYYDLLRNDKKYIEFENKAESKIFDFIKLEAFIRHPAVKGKKIDKKFIDNTIKKIFNRNKNAYGLVTFRIAEARKEIMKILENEYQFLTFNFTKINIGVKGIENYIEEELKRYCIKSEKIPIEDDIRIKHDDYLIKTNISLIEEKLIKNIKDKKIDNPNYSIIKKILFNTRSQLGALAKKHPELKRISRQILLADMFFIYDCMEVANYEKEKDIKGYYLDLFDHIIKEIRKYYINKLVDLKIFTEDGAREYVSKKDSNTIKDYYSLMYEFINNKKFEPLSTIPE